MNCECDYDVPQWHRESHVKARKQHRCCECDGSIEKGQEHRVIAGKWDGSVMQFRTCEYCLRVLQMVDCKCIPLGYLVDEIYQREYEGIEFAERWKTRREKNQQDRKLQAERMKCQTTSH